MLFFSFWLPWQPQLWLKFNLLNNFGRASPKEHPCHISSRLAQWFWRRRCLKKLWTTHDRRWMTEAGHWAITKAHHEHFMLRWAKKEKMLVTLDCVVNSLQHDKILTNYHTTPHFDALKIYSCGKHCEKRRNCLLQAISSFLTMFSTVYTLIFHFKCTLKCRLQFISIWSSLKFCRLVMF